MSCSIQTVYSDKTNNDPTSHRDTVEMQEAKQVDHNPLLLQQFTHKDRGQQHKPQLTNKQVTWVDGNKSMLDLRHD